MSARALVATTRRAARPAGISVRCFSQAARLTLKESSSSAFSLLSPVPPCFLIKACKHSKYPGNLCFANIPILLFPSADPNVEDFDRHKQDSLAKQKKGEGHWKPELASVSEEVVKADRMGPREAGEAAMKRLQDQTKQSAEETRKHGTSMKDGL